MAADRHLNYQQLSMFMPAGELRALDPNPHDRYDTEGTRHGADYLYEAKLDQAIDNGLAAKIREEGVRKPVHLYHAEEGEHTFNARFGGEPLDTQKPTVAQGHHRVAVSSYLNPEQLVPVRHYGAVSQPSDNLEPSPFIYAVRNNEGEQDGKHY